MYNRRLAFEAFVVLNSQGLQKPHYTMCMKKRERLCLPIPYAKECKGMMLWYNTVCIIMIMILGGLFKNLYNFCVVTLK